VGVTHARIGLEPKWYVGAFREYLSGMVDTLWTHSDGRREQFVPAFDALLKVALFDLGLTLDTYIHADKRRIALRDRAIESSVNGVFIADAGQPCYPLIYVNPAFERVLGSTAGTIVGKPCICRDEVADGYAEIRRAIAHGTEGNTVLRLRRADGERRWIELFLAPVRSEAGAVTHFVGVLNDVTDRKDAEARLSHLANHDPLTGLPNRNLLHDRLAHAITRRGEGLNAVLFLDLDRFKLINDSYGHDVGDELLRAVAARLQHCLRAGDTVARLGGDEFVVLLEDLPSVDAAAAIAGKIASRLSVPVTVGERELPLAASVGIALHPRDGADPQTLLKHADTAMYRAKEAGRGGFCFFAADMNAQALQRLTLENDLRRALENGELEVFYQAQVALDDGRLTGAEALVRWRHPEKGLVPPAAFIPVAEETGLIVSLGEQVLRAACRQLAAWQRRGLPRLTVAVNLSPRQFRQPDLVDRVAAILAETGADPGWLELEITESAAMQHAEETIRAAPAARDGRLAGDRRLRHRLFLAVLPEALPDRQAQDRPFLCPGRARQRRRRRDRAGDHRDGPQPRPGAARRRGGKRGPARLPPGARVCGRAGLAVRPGRARGRLRARPPCRARRLNAPGVQRVRPASPCRCGAAGRRRAVRGRGRP